MLQPSCLVAVLAAAQATRAEAQAREARRARLAELLAAEGLQAYTHVCYLYSERGDGSEEEALEAARAAHERAAAQEARQARIDELLAAEGLQQYSSSCRRYILQNEGSEEEAVESARRAQQVDQERQARRTALAAALEAEGIQLTDALASGVQRFLYNGTGTQQQGGHAVGPGVAGLGHRDVAF